ncbi:hypothetical protein PFLUV_G00128150 [Perca fluviatilis]|uniref:DnaJ homolog subfamily C member 1 n=1 Tax=Perca fluviatilis TaxID=8168 RepID=A0A6A5F416_PERFL|nr:hypothetical protein PFLUV_G00128150 [Perca fluviatilis]
MRVCLGPCGPPRLGLAPCGPTLLGLALLLAAVPPLWAWDADLELLDLVEEIPQSFYQFMSLDQDASALEVKKAYRRLSLSLHPDKNRDENAETQFRQLVAIYEVLKDEERRRKYDDILENGSSGLDELLSKKKKEKKKKLSSRPPDELRSATHDRAYERPHWQDILPLKLSIWLYLSIKNLPHTVQELKQYYEDYQLMKQQQREEAEAEQEVVPREKRPKVKKMKLEFPVYELQTESVPSYCQQDTSIEDIEDQMDDWLQDRRAARKKAADWTDEEISLLSRLMVKFPGGSPGRWEKIAHELGRSVSDVTTKVKQVKDNVSHTSGNPGLVKLSDLKGPLPPVRSFPVADGVMTQREGGACEEEAEQEAAQAVRKRNRKSAADGAEGKVRGRRQRDFDPVAVAEEEEEGGQGEGPPENGAVWTQNQQKLLELALQQFPRGTTERWDRIAKTVPGKTKEECMIRYKMLAELRIEVLTSLLPM